MDKSVADEIIACLEGDRWLFNYFRDRYAFLLTAWSSAGQVELSDTVLKQLRHKPRLKQWFAERGGLDVDAQDLLNAWCDDTEPFVLSLGCWHGFEPSYDQVSRKGVNLVLRVGLNNRHTALLNHLVKPENDEVFQCSSHPVLQRDEPWPYRNTLSWVRIDLDLETNEALIEEIQTDWIRMARWTVKAMRNNRRYDELKQIKGSAANVQKFCETSVDPLSRIWDEASLAAALHFLINDIGIGCVYYHTFESGCAIKRLTWSRPPRSLYTQLPRRFGMRLVKQPPRFLAKDKGFKRLNRKLNKTEWYRIDTGEKNYAR